MADRCLCGSLCSKTKSSASPFTCATDVWYMDAIDLIVSSGRGDEVADNIRERLVEAGQYLRPVAQNATSMAHQFHNLLGLKLLLSNEMRCMEKARGAAMSKLEQLHARCSAPSGDFIEQAGQCGRCRAEMGIRGRWVREVWLGCWV